MGEVLKIPPSVASDPRRSFASEGSLRARLDAVRPHNKWQRRLYRGGVGGWGGGLGNLCAW